jgi:hypothetical protein
MSPRENLAPDEPVMTPSKQKASKENRKRKAFGSLARASARDADWHLSFLQEPQRFVYKLSWLTT